MKKSKLHLQMNLSKFSEMKIKELYKIPQDQKVELAIWAGKAFDADIREKGFVFTNSAMYWNFPTSGETAEGTNFVAKEAVLKSVETGANEIAVSTDSKDIKFTLNEKFTSDDAAFIKAVISSYYTDYKLTKTFAADIVAKDENNSIVFTYLMTSDFFTEGVAGVKNKFAKKEKSKDIQTSSETSSTSTETTSASDTDANSNADSSSNGTATESKKEKKAKSKKEKTSEDKPKVGFFTKFGHFWRHILDVIVDLILILGIVLLLKPDLFPKNEAVVLEVPEIQEQVKLNDSVDNQIDIEVDKIEPALIEKPADIIEPASNTAPSSEEAILIPEEPAVKPVSETPAITTSTENASEAKAVTEDKKVSKNAAKELKAEYKRKKAELKAQKKMLRKQSREDFYKNYGRAILCFAIFIILKILIIASSNKSRKAVSIILLAILIVFTVCAFIPNTSPNAAEYAKLIPFGVYLIILALILLCLQFSMGFDARAVGRKVFWFLLIAVVGYIWIHASLPDFADTMKLAGERIGEAFSMLDVPVKWW